MGFHFKSALKKLAIEKCACELIRMINIYLHMQIKLLGDFLLLFSALILVFFFLCIIC